MAIESECSAAFSPSPSAEKVRHVIPVDTGTLKACSSQFALNDLQRSGFIRSHRRATDEFGSQRYGVSRHLKGSRRPRIEAPYYSVTDSTTGEAEVNLATVMSRRVSRRRSQATIWHHLCDASQSRQNTGLASEQGRPVTKLGVHRKFGPACATLRTLRNLAENCFARRYGRLTSTGESLHVFGNPMTTVRSSGSSSPAHAMVVSGILLRSDAKHASGRSTVHVPSSSRCAPGYSLYSGTTATEAYIIPCRLRPGPCSTSFSVEWQREHIRSTSRPRAKPASERGSTNNPTSSARPSSSESGDQAPTHRESPGFQNQRKG